MQQGGKRVALLMGSFNPVHTGHLAVAQYVVAQELADEVWMVVSPQNPLKNPTLLAPFTDRLAMVRMAVEAAGDPRLKASDAEAALPQPSYTIHTIEYLRECYPDVQFCILAGSDIADQLPRWHRSEELRRLVRFLIYPRNHGTASPEMADAPLFAVDSTSIRAALAAGLPVADNMVPSVVRDYLQSKKLYTMDGMTPDEWNEAIERAPNEAGNYFARGCLHYRHNDFGPALNDFTRTLELEPGHTVAAQMSELIREIFSFRNFDLYNP